MISNLSYLFHLIKCTLLLFWSWLYFVILGIAFFFVTFHLLSIFYLDFHFPFFYLDFCFHFLFEHLFPFLHKSQSDLGFLPSFFLLFFGVFKLVWTCRFWSKLVQIGHFVRPWTFIDMFATENYARMGSMLKHIWNPKVITTKSHGILYMYFLSQARPFVKGSIHI